MLSQTAMEEFISSQEQPPPGLNPGVAEHWANLSVDARRVFVRPLLTSGTERQDGNTPYENPFLQTQDSFQTPSTPLPRVRARSQSEEAILHEPDRQRRRMENDQTGRMQTSGGLLDDIPIDPSLLSFDANTDVNCE
jgi:hypothetical protein